MTAKADGLVIIGRSSSHFTRVARIFALELGVPFELQVVHDMKQTDAARFGDNPARKMPTLKRADSLLFGTENICRALAETSTRKLTIIWPEALRSDLMRNAQEMVWHVMNAQTQVVVGTMVNKLPADDPFFVKVRVGMEGALAWLDQRWSEIEAALPARDLSLLEVTLFCLLEHMEFRVTVPLAPYTRLTQFAKRFAMRDSARATPFVFDPHQPVSTPT